MSFVVRVAGFEGIMRDVAFYVECIKHSLLYSTGSITTYGTLWSIDHYPPFHTLTLIITIIQHPKITLH
jgi:hypothetical protein